MDRTYASKNDLLYVLDVINLQFYNDIRLIGYIRNCFAHSHVETSFSDKEVQRYCNELFLWERPKAPFEIDEWIEKRNR